MALRLVRRLRARALLGWGWLEECVDKRVLIWRGDGYLVLGYLDGVCSWRKTKCDEARGGSMVTYTLFLFSIMHYMLYLITGILLRLPSNSMVCIVSLGCHLRYTATLNAAGL